MQNDMYYIKKQQLQVTLFDTFCPEKPCMSWTTSKQAHYSVMTMIIINVDYW